jgi:hypothetical protein
MVSISSRASVVAAFALLALVEPSAADQLKIKGVQESYAADTAIPFTVVKQVPHSVTFACAAETLVDGEFREFRWNIFKNGLKPPFRDPIQLGQGAADLRWDIPKQMQAIRPRAGWTCRLRIDVLTPKPEQIYSQPFAITQPSSRRRSDRPAAPGF